MKPPLSESFGRGDVRRVDFPRAASSRGVNIVPRYPADLADWIWHPDRLSGTAFLRFSLLLDVECEESQEIQVSADQRFQISLNGVEFAQGPDRSDLAHWSVQTYRVVLKPGLHVFEALVWWIASPAYGVPDFSPASPPMAQMSFRGGFLFAAPGAAAARYNTGSAAWKVEDLTHAVALEKGRIAGYHDIGPSFVVDAAEWNRPGPKADPVVVREAVEAGNASGVARPGWKLETTPLPEQRREAFSGGFFRGLDPGVPPLDRWRNLLEKGEALEVGVHETTTVLWDFRDYLCGYPVLQTRGGTGAVVSLEWAEALYESPDSSQASEGPLPKGHRDQTEGKHFVGFGDKFLCAGEKSTLFPAFWWRSGRFLRIQVQTGDESLLIERLEVCITGYPLESEGSFASDDPDLERIAALAFNTLRQGSHDLLVDSPYYEQMAYVGDNLTEALVTYVLTPDTRLVRRAIELFDWSRAASGLVAERWPSACHQESATYAMLWPVMVRNHAWWRDEEEFIGERLRGVRHLIEELLVFRREDGLLDRLPGWSFVDWVPEWWGGYPPGHEEGDSSIIHMHWLWCLRSAADLEEHFGDPELVRRLRRLEAQATESLTARYRCPESGLFFDDTKGRLSEHANALATLVGLRPRGDAAWPEKLATFPHARCSVYFAHYLFEAFAAMRRADLFFSRLDLWRGFLNQGLRTIPEQPEPSRSDCHAWGAHPLFHFHADLAGVRPSSPGFQTVRVSPLFGPLETITGTLPHPRGCIFYDLHGGRTGVHGTRVHGTIVLPEGVTGTLEAGGPSVELSAGKNSI